MTSFLESMGLTWYSLLEIAGVIVGLIYLWLEYKASIHLWIASIIMPAIYLIVYKDAGLYADMAINIYYLAIAVYGWLSWKYNFSLGSKKESTELKISHISTRGIIYMLMLYVVAQLAISLSLIHFTDSDVPWFNGLTSALSIVGMWMLARKQIEQWIVWIVVDVLSAILYFTKDLDYTGALYILYAVVAVFGYRKWNQLLKQQNED
jgi:nicotinamide mononucleotide transporter